MDLNGDAPDGTQQVRCCWSHPRKWEKSAPNKCKKEKKYIRKPHALQETINTSVTSICGGCGDSIFDEDKVCVDHSFWILDFSVGKFMMNWSSINANSSIRHPFDWLKVYILCKCGNNHLYSIVWTAWTRTQNSFLFLYFNYMQSNHCIGYWRRRRRERERANNSIFKYRQHLLNTVSPSSDIVSLLHTQQLFSSSTAAAAAATRENH